MTLAELLIEELLLRALREKIEKIPGALDFADREVAQHRDGNLHISTVRTPSELTGGRTVFQTGISHPDYTPDGQLRYYVVVGEYESREAAEAGHAAWVEAFSKPEHEWPDQLRDVSSCEPTVSDDLRVIRRYDADDDVDMAS